MMIRNKSPVWMLLLALGMSFSTSGNAQQPKPATKASKSAKPPSKPVVPPVARLGLSPRRLTF